MDIHQWVVDSDSRFFGGCAKVAADSRQDGYVSLPARIDVMDGRNYVSAEGVILAEIRMDRRSSTERAWDDALKANQVTLASVDFWQTDRGWRVKVYVRPELLTTAGA